MKELKQTGRARLGAAGPVPSRDELIEHVRALNAEILELRCARDEDAWFAEALKRRTRALDESLRELNWVLTAVRELRSPLSRHERAALIIESLPAALQGSSRCCVRAVLDADEFATPGFVETRWGLRERVVSGGRDIGWVEVFYPAKIPEAGEGPIPRQESALLAVAAECLGIVFDGS